MAKKKSDKNKASVEYAEVKINHSIFKEYLQYGPQYDTVNDCPVIPGETEFVPRQKLAKLSKSMRGMLREYMNHAVTDYWDEHRQIPVAGDLKLLRKKVLDTLLSEFNIYVKDDKDTSLFLNDTVAITINRILKDGRDRIKRKSILE